MKYRGSGSVSRAKRIKDLNKRHRNRQGSGNQPRTFIRGVTLGELEQYGPVGSRDRRDIMLINGVHYGLTKTELRRMVKQGFGTRSEILRMSAG